MQWSLGVLSLLCSTCCFAERRSDQAIARLEPNIEGTDGSQRISDEDGEPPCAQEASLRAVLQSLGVPDDRLQNVRSFREVQWNGCDVTGIYLNSRDLHGSLAKELSELHALEHLELPDNNITGNLDVFKENAALRHLDLDNTRISGDLQSLAKATGLWHLRLRGTQVYGDVVALSNAKELQRLHLTETKVYGDLVALSNATFFTCLDLSETKVYGDLVALKNAKYLYFLDLSETKVHGDLACLANLTELGILKLSGPKVSGDFSVILKWKTIKDLGLSGTKVTSHPTEKWQHCCEHLKTLDLAWSKIHIVDGFLANFPLYNLREDKLDCPFSALTALDMTGTTLNTTVGKLLKPFLGCKELRIFKAAECSLTGPMPYKIMYGWIPEIQLAMSSKIDIWPLSQVLQLLDLSSNNVTKVEGLPGNCRAVSFRGNPQISFGEDVVKKATEHFVSLDLRNATFTHPTEVADLFDSRLIKQNRARTVINEQDGFECYDLDSTSIQITPEKFAPDRLCSCSPGWKGSGAKCEKCPENFFAENYDSEECIKCPQGSKAPAGSTSHSSCICDVGVLYKSNGTWRCGCREHEAFLDETCVKCSDFHLNCPSHGTQVFSAQPLKGYTRLKNENHAFKCLKPDIRCDAEHVNSDVAMHNGSTLGACREGYTDVMCMDCAPKYFSSGNQCERCHDSTMFSTGAPIMVAALVLILAVIGGGIWLWMQRNRHAEVQQGTWSGALKEQLRAQVPILLQLCQLWPVLAVLATKTGNGGTDQDTNTMQDHKEGNEEVGFASAFWEVPYVQGLQLSIFSLKGAFNLQCKFDGAMVRFISALVAPVVPLAVMLCCMLLELLKPGSGINAGLQALTLLYIGGASSTSSLLSCQEVDGAGDSLPRQFAFRTAMPYILCHEESQLKHSVDTLAFSSAFFYGIIIPCCLLYLYGRQHVLFQSNRTTVAIVADHGSLKVSLHKVLESTVQKTGNVEFTRRLVAAAAASISVLCRGKVSLRVVDGSALIELLDGSVNAASDQLEPDLLSFIDAEDAKQQAKQQKCWSLCEMLTERSILQDVAPSDRVISGAKTLLLKYALCRSIWMEIVQRLVAVFLVSVVASANGLQLSVTITLMMAATSAMVQPFARPQVNRLHCCSFICLAMAAASFANTWVWTSRVALAVPFLLTAAQVFRPDSLENLAIRLWEELEPQIEALQRGEPVEVTSETYNFF